MSVQKHFYGWHPGLPKLAPSYRSMFEMPITLPKSVDLRNLCPNVYDQESLGSCTANAGAGLGQFLMIKLKKPQVYRPARLAIYYWERELENTVNTDSGASLSDCIKVLSENGMPNEYNDPYDVTKFTEAPTTELVTFGNSHKVDLIAQINNLYDMKHCLAMGFPFIFGFTVYESFESGTVAKTGIVPMPKASEQVLGGHATVAVGFSDDTQRFIVRNSWGISWGDKGYCYMPYDYLTNPNLATDMWTAQGLSW